MKGIISGEQVGNAARFDKQFRVPRRPSRRLGVDIEIREDATVLWGSDRLQTFTGGMKPSLIEDILQACDGTKTARELASVCDVTEPLMDKIVALLWVSGAIEEAGPTDVESSPLGVLLSRLGNATGANASWQEAQHRINSMPICVMPHSELGTEVAGALAGTFEVVSEEAAFERGVVLFIFIETASSKIEQHHKFDELTKRRVLLVSAAGDEVVVGPLYDQAITPCLRCCSSSRIKLDRGPSSPAQLRLMAGIVSHHIVALVSRALLSPLPTDSLALNVVTGVQRYSPPVSRPGCPECSHAIPAIASEPTVGAVYEASVALPPREFVNVRDYQAHFLSANQQLQTKFKSWGKREKFPLPDINISDLHIQIDDLLFLAAALRFGFGIDPERTTSKIAKRWTASGGNIGSVNAFVSLPAMVGHIPSGIYGYSVSDHSLAKVSQELISATDIMIAASADLRKIVSKYGTFGLRIAIMDAGCALSTVRRVCREVGRTFSMWSADLDAGSISEMLHLSSAREPIIGVSVLGKGQRG